MPLQISVRAEYLSALSTLRLAPVHLGVVKQGVLRLEDLSARLAKQLCAPAGIVADFVRGGSELHTQTHVLQVIGNYKEMLNIGKLGTISYHSAE